MWLRATRSSTQFYVALGVLVVALAAMAVVGLSGLASVEGANQQVYQDNYRTSEVTSATAVMFGRVGLLSQEILDADARGQADVLRAQLANVAIPRANATLNSLVAIHQGDPPDEYAGIQRIIDEWGALQPILAGPAFSISAPVQSDAVRDALSQRLERTLGPLADSVWARQQVEEKSAAEAQAGAHRTFNNSRLWLIITAVLAALAAAVLVRVGITLRRLVNDQTEAQKYGASSAEFTDTLQATENEGEAQELLRHQIQRTHPGSRAVVLARNNSADRLEPRTSLAELDELTGPLEHAAPRSCLAVRFARSHTQGGERVPLTSCEVCGALPGTSTCEPLLVGGEVIGSVLVAHTETPDQRTNLRIREAVGQAAPVLGNLRNLAIAELRAATDRLTGLPNQRAVQETLKRMVAQASRTITPLSAVLIDLDHFKQINDVYGHDRGDEALAAVGVALRNAVRESDFIGRYGGEEFLLLLPGTDTEGAVQVAEAVRVAVGAVRIAGIDRPVTASAGVANLPRHAGDSVTLFRAADRALYAAKNAGRNRVEVASDETAAAGEAPAGEAPGEPSVGAVLDVHLSTPLRLAE